MLEEFRSEKNILKEIPLTYAGRLDPMAEGILLILIGEECKKKEEYTALDKEYEFEVLFGATTDTGDVLGMASEVTLPVVVPDELKEVLPGLTGLYSFEYPPFSSKTVRGRPLHEWALEDRLSEIQIPERSVLIHHLSLLDVSVRSGEVVKSEIMAKLSLFDPDESLHRGPGGDFRKSQIIERWSEVLAGKENGLFPIARFRVNASSGLYVRVLAADIARRAGTQGFAYSIKRTRVGEFT